MPKVIASDFASIKDLAAYRLAKARGLSDKEAFKVGDNGIGCWGDNTAQNDIPMCALPPDDMIARWGSIAAAKNHPVLVIINGKRVACKLADRMPWKKNINNGAGIDLNPAAISRFNLKSPMMVAAEWMWIDPAKAATPTPTPAKKGLWQRLLFWRN